MATPKFSTEELDLLSEEERAGLLEDIDNGDEEGDTAGDGAEAEAAAVDEPAAGAKVDEPAAAGATDTATAEAAAAAAVVQPGTEAAGNIAAEAAAGTVIEHEAAGAEDGVTAPGPAWRPLPADNATKIADIDKQLDELSQKFDDGDLTGGEYRAQMRVLDNQKADLREEKFRAVIAQEAAMSHWSDVAVPAFLEKHAQYAEPGTFLYSALDSEVRKLQTTADNPFDPRLLAQAHKTIDEQIRKATGALPAPKQDPAAATTTTPAAKRVVPPSLAHVPAADINDADSDGSKFAWLDRLADTDALAYENALGKMSEAEREQYLAN